MPRTVIRNGNVLDTSTMTYAEATLVIEAGRVVDVDAAPTVDGDIVIDAGGSYVVPGLVDCHVHFRLATLNFQKLARMSEVEFGITMAQLSRATVERGFTTVRDLGGEVTGLMAAIRAGKAIGPRIVRAGRMLSQTGGHGDVRPGAVDVASCGCSLHSDVMSIVADGPDAVRKAARHNLREGSDFLKIHVSGGVASPTDPLESVQYTPEEIQAAVTEAEHRHTYVAAHAYSAESITMAVENGVHTIEHGNLIDATAAAAAAHHGAVVVPTLVTYRAMDELGQQLGLPAKNLEKNAMVLDAGRTAVEIARDAGVTLGFGTDLIGETQIRQNEELAIQADIRPAAEVLHSMWQVNPTLCHLDGEIGTLTPGAFGDAVISTVDPLEDLAAFADHETAFTHVVQGGSIIVDRTTG